MQKTWRQGHGRRCTAVDRRGLEDRFRGRRTWSNAATARRSGSWRRGIRPPRWRRWWRSRRSGSTSSPRYEAEGADALGDRRRGNRGAKPLLDEADLEALRERLKTPPDGGRPVARLELRRGRGWCTCMCCAAGRLYPRAGRGALAHRTLTQLSRIGLHRPLRLHGSNLSDVGASGKRGAVHGARRTSA